MSIRALVSRILGAHRRSVIDAELGEEIAEHLRLAEDAHRAAGLSPADARAAARREFGNAALARQTSREAWGWPALDDWAADLRFGSRVLRKHWPSTLVAIGALGLAIGVTTAVVSTFDAIVNVQHPYPDAGRLAIFWAKSTRDARIYQTQISAPELRRWQRGATTATLAGFTWSRSANLTMGDKATRVSAMSMTSNMLAVLGVAPAMGRGFLPEDERADAPNAAIVTYAFWNDALGGDPAALSKPVVIDRQPYAIVGVMPRGFVLPILRRAQVFLPARGAAWGSDRSARTIVAIGRVVPGKTIEAAGAEMSAASVNFHDDAPGERGQWTVNEDQLTWLVRERATHTLNIFLALALLVLMVACANVAILLLARIPARAHELAIRLALGAEQRRVLRQLLVESSLLAVGGCVTGLLIARPAMRLLMAVLGDMLMVDVAPAIDVRAIGIAGLLAVVTCLLFGVAPAMSALKRLRAGASLAVGRGTGDVERSRLRWVLVAAEVALSIVLAVGGWLMIENVRLVNGRDLGFERRGLVTAKVTLDSARYPTAAQQEAYFTALVARLGAHSELSDATAAMALPLSGETTLASYMTKAPAGERPDTVIINAIPIMPSYFAAMHIPIVEGSMFRGDETEPVVVINENVARRWWPGQSAIGKRIRVMTPMFDDGVTLAPGERRIVGVARDMRHSPTVTETAFATMFVPYRQSPVRMMMIAVRAPTPAAGAAVLRDEARVLDPMLPVFSVRSIDELLDEWTGPVHLDAVIVDCLAAVGLLLTLVGIYSVVAVFVSQRTREIGIRIAVGARTRDVIAMVLHRTLIPAVVGGIAGVAAALIGTRWLRSLLNGVSPLEPRAFVGAALLLAVVVLAAAIVPARRAARLDPLIALRMD